MADDRIFLQVKGNPENRILLAKKHGTWYAPQSLTNKSLNDWFDKNMVAEIELGVESQNNTLEAIRFQKNKKGKDG